MGPGTRFQFFDEMLGVNTGRPESSSSCDQMGQEAATRSIHFNDTLQIDDQLLGGCRKPPQILFDNRHVCIGETTFNRDDCLLLTICMRDV
jgi:hypothetical protein